MASTQRFATETRDYMLFSLRDWIEVKSGKESGEVTIGPEAVESMGSDVGLGKPEAHELFLGFIEEGYLDGEVSVEEADLSPLREARLRGFTHKGASEIEEIIQRRGQRP